MCHLLIEAFKLICLVLEEDGSMKIPYLHCLASTPKAVVKSLSGLLK